MSAKNKIFLTAFVASCVMCGQLFAQGSDTRQGSATKQQEGSAVKQEGSAVKQEGSAAKQEPTKTVAESIDPNSFSTLWHAVRIAGLAEALGGEGPFTVFAPNDTAFGTIPQQTTQALLNNPPKMATLLKYHVVPGKVMAADVVGLTEAKTLLGETLKIETRDGNVFINGVRVSKTDIECTNGVIHLIEGVFMPSQAAMDKAGMEGSASKEGSEMKEGSGTNEGSETKTEPAGSGSR